MKNITKSKIYYSVIDWMRAIAIILVPITHSSYNETFNTNVFVAYSDIFAHISVPIFVFISGFLSYRQSKNKIIKRLPRILIPYLIASIFCQLIKFRNDLAGNILTIFYNLLTGDSFGIYYFVFVITYLYFIGIIINRFYKHIGKFLLFAFLISLPFFIFSTIKDNSLYYVSRELYYRFPLNWIVFFVLGMWVNSIQDFSKILRYKYHYLLSTIVSYILIVWANINGYWVIYGSLFWFIASASTIFTLFSFLQETKPFSIILYLSKTSYTIYLLHIFPLALMYYFVKLDDIQIIKYSLPLTIVLAVTTTLFSIIIREIAHKIFHSKAHFIVGS